MGLKKASQLDEADEGVQPETLVENVATPPGSGFTYMTSVFRWSDGKSGVTVKVLSEQQRGETHDQLARRVNRFTVLKLRELEDELTTLESER